MEQRENDRDAQLRVAQRRRDVALAWYMANPNDNRAAAALWRATEECRSLAGTMLSRAEENYRRASEALEESEAELAAEHRQAPEQ